MATTKTPPLKKHELFAAVGVMVIAVLIAIGYINKADEPGETESHRFIRQTCLDFRHDHGRGPFQGTILEQADSNCKSVGY